MARIEIIGGPPLGRIMCSLMQGNPTPRMTVTFVANGALITESSPNKNARRELHVEVAITGMDQEDGSGDSWIFRGYATTRMLGGPGKIDGYFCTLTRHGWFRFSDQKA